MVNGDIPRRVKKDAHAVILEFIRSRPPLRKVGYVNIFIFFLYILQTVFFIGVLECFQQMK